MPVPVFFFSNAYLLNRRLQGDTTTGSGIGTDDQYPPTGLHGGHHHGHHQEVTGTGVKPSMKDKIVGGVEKVAGKMTSNTEMYQRGEERAVSWFSPSICSVLNICFEYQGWRECKEELLSSCNLARRKKRTYCTLLHYICTVWLLLTFLRYLFPFPSSGHLASILKECGYHSRPSKNLFSRWVLGEIHNYRVLNGYMMCFHLFSHCPNEKRSPSMFVEMTSTRVYCLKG